MGEDEDDHPTQVLIVSAETLIRKALVALLSDVDGMMIGDSDCVLCAASDPGFKPPDVVVLHDHTGAEIAEAHQTFIDIPLIVLISHPDDAMISTAFKSGALSILTTDINVSQFVEAINAAEAGQAILSPDVTAALIRMTVAPPPLGADLTRRECEVLSLMVKGLHNNEIAESLCITVSTVQFHVSSILSKLHVSNRVEAVALAVSEGLI
jgi:NarL family two-component system response regulator LiaR